MTANEPSRKDAILDVAEEMARRGGYDGFSFREVAKSVGVKASSVHYHFPGKEALGEAVAQRYTERFMAALGEADDARTAKDKLAAYIELYRKALVADDLMCLCGAFGAQIDSLPPRVGEAARRFFRLNIAWLTTALRGEAEEGLARRVVALLEGGLMLARSLGDAQVFEDAATGVLGLLEAESSTVS